MNRIFSLIVCITFAAISFAQQPTIDSNQQFTAMENYDNLINRWSYYYGY